MSTVYFKRYQLGFYSIGITTDMEKVIHQLNKENLIQPNNKATIFYQCEMTQEQYMKLCLYLQELKKDNSDWTAVFADIEALIQQFI